MSGGDRILIAPHRNVSSRDKNDATPEAPNYANHPLPSLRSTIAHTDGACSDNGQRGARAGFGVWVSTTSSQNVSLPLSPREQQTNNRAELTALIFAMCNAELEDRLYEQIQMKPAPMHLLTLVTDSMYCYNGAEKWMWAWIRNGWKASNGQTVENVDLWKMFLRVRKVREERIRGCIVQLEDGSERASLPCSLDFAQRNAVWIEWVKGHSTNKGNEAADVLAKAGCTEQPPWTEPPPSAALWCFQNVFGPHSEPCKRV